MRSPTRVAEISLPHVVVQREEPIAGRYAVIRELGRGGMATVFLAHDLTLDRPVAVKVLHTELATHLGGGRFTREIRITSRLRHPGILPLLDSGEVDGIPFFTMPFIDGETLGQRLDRERQLSIDATVQITFEVLDALEYAHGQGVLHRDIKPSNVLLSGGHAMLADFGVARAVDTGAGDTLTDSGLAVGTAQYMSPEQASADRLDERSDIYALGCVVYEMLAGAPPFTGPTTQAVLARHAVDAVPSLRIVRRTVSRRLQRVIERCLAKVPADRYANVPELRVALVAAMTATDDEDEDDRTSARRRVLLLGLAAVVLILAASVLWSRMAGKLDTNRVVGFPLQSPPSIGGVATSGEDVATAIGSALDRRGTLRWIDGWRLLSAKDRAAGTAIDPVTARAIARSQHAAYYLTGRIVAKGDAADVLLELVDVASDTVIARPGASGPPKDLWRAGLRSVNQLLPILIPGGATRDLAASWADRDPAAVASFLAGEAAFRRAHPALALTYYRQAVAADSDFALAAVRGAQAATWDHHPAEAAALVKMALGKPMAPQYAHFTMGYNAYLEGRPDSAVAEFRRSLAIDPEMAAAWAQLGETYVHLVTTARNPDSLADAAFDAARATDSSSSHLLLHPIEIRLRRGDADGAAALITRFSAAGPNASTLQELELAERCVRNGPTGVDWPVAVRRNAEATMWSAIVLGAHGANLDCAVAAYNAVLDADTSAIANNRQSALVGLVGLLVARGQPDLVRERIAKSIARGEGGSSLFMLSAPLAPSLAPAAATVAARDSARFGATFDRCSTTERCWILSVYQASRGNAAAVTAISNALTTRTTKDSAAPVQLLVHAAAAQSLLARGDSAAAMAALRALLSEPMPSSPSMGWDPGGALGAERLAYARLLLSSERFAQARAVADAFDAPSPASFPLYLRASLELRALAADRQQDTRAALAYRARLAALAAPTTPTARRR